MYKMKPFIIWTLQRTGGTNLTTKLVELSGLKSAPHEPFNSGRIYGHITDQWNESRDRTRLDIAVSEIVDQGQVIKHCIETVPWQVTESLALAAISKGYGHLFQYRRNPLNRLLSLHFAKVSGIWGPDMKAMKLATGAPEINIGRTNKAEIATANFPLPVEDLIKHEINCNKIMYKLYDLIRSHGVTPAILAYEDVYLASSNSSLSCVLKSALHNLSINYEESNFSAWCSDVIGIGDQGTKALYREFPRYSELVEQCAHVAPFKPNNSVLSILNISHNLPWVIDSFIDVYPRNSHSSSNFNLEGVVVLSGDAPAESRLVLLEGDNVVDVEWGINSPRMKLNYPNAINSAASRWRVNYNGDVSKNLILGLSTPIGKIIFLHEIIVSDKGQPDDLFLKTPCNQ